MASSTTHSPMLLVFPPELAISKLQQTGLIATPYVPRNVFSKILASNLKIFGAIQILFGLMIFSFGIIMFFTLVEPYPRFPFIFISGYPFWGSMLFVNSGAFLIVLKRKPTEKLGTLTMLMTITAVELLIALSFLIFAGR
ncbi:PREDICTED: membrane-spanning 4-domains subfamily A member 5 [Chrysochloris asiatica]|uniref:Membrane-spanning 4-domains subfamily A member 5 n=1 Tax=Chrysochloris asiatica TaxID=185453 RepID=A0A9B0U387_CHRAS|nr:PREDICTED: membrane-spanning 4-domains subfamily A member 5 [Chrysochloris asiatica]